MNTAQFTKDEILNYLKNVTDPEIPVLNVVEMGIVVDVDINSDGTVVYITPTYSGCPAMKTIEDEIKLTLKEKNISDVKVEKIYKPAWSTDMLSDETKKKLKDYGIAPPGDANDEEFYMSVIKKPVECPYCSSRNTRLTSEFGSTACKALHYCDECSQPFEHFKCI